MSDWQIRPSRLHAASNVHKHSTHLIGKACHSVAVAFGAAGFSHDSPKTPNVHILRVSRFKNTSKIQREDPQREKQKENGSGRGKKKAKFWWVRRRGRGVRRRGVRGKGLAQGVWRREVRRRWCPAEVVKKKKNNNNQKKKNKNT